MKEDQEKQRPRPTERNIQLPLTHDSWAVLTGCFPISESEWNQMMITLNTMRPGLVVNE